MSDKIAAMKAALALEEAEQAFREKKAAGKLTKEDRMELRELRRAYREDVRIPVEDGAQPEAIGAKSGVRL